MNIFYDIHRLMLRVVFSAFFNIRTFNRANVPLQGPVLVVSNHQSFLDPMLCGLGLNRELDYLARDSLFRNPCFGAYIRALNAFPVQRDHADTKAIKDIINRLKAGRAIVAGSLLVVGLGLFGERGSEVLSYQIEVRA